MKKITPFSKLSLLFFGLLCVSLSDAQIGIGTTTPAPGSILDVNSTTKGILVPRVNITNLATLAPVVGASDGLLVWSINPTNRGYHYWNLPTNRWIPLIPATATSNDWSVLGNAGTVNATNFLGTITTGRELNIRTENINRMRVQADGLVTVNRAALNAFAGDQFSTFTTTGSANNGYAVSGIGVYGQTTTGIGVYGIAGGNGDATWGIATSGDGMYGETISSNGVWGQATSGMGVRGQSTSNRGVLGISNNQAGVQGNSTSNAGVVGLGSTFGTIGDVTNGVGAQGQATTGDGVRGISTSGNGVYGQTTSNNGVWGQATTGIGVRGQAGSGIASLGISNSGVGVQGQSTTSTGVIGISGASGNGVYGQSTSGNGVFGSSTSGNGVVGTTTNNTVSGGRFNNSAPLGHGLLAAGNNQLPTVIGASGAGATATGLSIGMLGVANGTVGDGIVGIGNGIPGFYTDPFGAGSGVVANSDNIGVYAYTTTALSDGVYADGGTTAGGTGVRGVGFVGVVGIATNPAGFGVLAIGGYAGTGVKYFHIDHPLDPSNKYLNHASIESNEILNLYRGTESFDSNGRALVSMPDYYDAININASYQLTAIGASMPNLYIEKEIENGQFIIAGGIAGKKVSWQLTAERNDPYLQKYPENRIMEIDKGEKRGTYLMPELFGKPKEQSYFYRTKQGTVAKTNGGGILHETSKLDIKTVKPTTDEGVIIEKALELKDKAKVEIEKTDVVRDLKQSKKSDESNDNETIMQKIGVVEDSKVKK